MTARWLQLLVRVLPKEVREEVLRELLEQHAGIRRSKGRAAVWWWVCRQPMALLAWRDRPSHTHWYSGLVDDVVITQRALRRRPALGVTVVATIAVCAAAIAGVASVVDAVMLRPLPFPEEDRLVWLATHEQTPTARPFDPALAATAYGNPMDVADWSLRARHITALTPFETFDGTIDAGGRPLRVGVASVSASTGQVLGIAALHGRLFAESDYPQAGRVLVMSHRLWRSAFGADPSLVGRTVRVGGDPVEVIGILPPITPAFPTAETDLWFPLVPRDATFRNRGGVWQRVVARLDRDVTIEQAASDMSRVARELATEYPDSNATRKVYVVPYRDGLVGSTRDVLLLMAGAVGLVLLIACANVGHLLLVSAQGRQRELAVRAALGAQPFRLARLLLVESTWLALAGGVVGLLLAPWFLRGFLQLYPDTLPAVGDVAIRLPALVAAAAATLCAAVLAVIPPLLTARPRQLQDTMRSAERGAEHRTQRHVRSALVVTQVALSTALLVGGGLLLRTFLTMKGTEPGFATANVLTFNLSLGPTQYPKLDAEVRFYDALLDRVRALPGVEAAGATTLLPLTPGEFGDGFYRVGFNDVYPKIPIARLQNVTAGYFEAVGLPVRKGRTFTPADVAGAQPVVIVNETLEKRDFPDGAIGRQIRFRGTIFDIVGVVGDKHHRSLREVPRADMYYPRAQVDNPRYLGWVAIRMAGDPGTLVGPLREIVSSIDSGVAIDKLDTMAARVDRALAPDRFRAVLVGALALVALLLAGLGLYGLITHAVARDTRNIAIRMALGADRRDAITRVVTHVMVLTVAGVMIGGALAYAGHTLVAGFLAGVDRFDPLTLVGVTVLLLTVTGVAALGPAARASRVDPADVLRSQ
jgi:putative ABC transport system permease protein